MTPSQEKALKEIIADLKGQRHTNRMLMGDVGSGKTVVAMLTCLFAKKCGRQSALMAPTEILARQHFRTAKNLFMNELNVELLTS